MHGALVASVFSSLLAGVAPGCVYVAQDLRFRAPVRAGEAVTGCVHVARVRGGRRGRGRGGVVLECRTRAYRHAAPPSAAAAATDDASSSGARPDAATLAVDGRARVWLPAGYEIEG